MSEERAPQSPLRVLTFVVPGRLCAWARARIDARGGKPVSFTSERMRSDQAMVRQIAWQALRAQCRMQLIGPLRLTVEVFRTVPASWSKKKQGAAKWITSKPDADNCLKMIADSLSRVAMADDAQIADARCIKQYGPID